MNPDGALSFRPWRLDDFPLFALPAYLAPWAALLTEARRRAHRPLDLKRPIPMGDGRLVYRRVSPEGIWPETWAHEWDPEGGVVWEPFRAARTYANALILIAERGHLDAPTPPPVPETGPDPHRFVRQSQRAARRYRCRLDRLAAWANLFWFDHDARAAFARQHRDDDGGEGAAPVLLLLAEPIAESNLTNGPQSALEM